MSFQPPPPPPGNPPPPPPPPGFGGSARPGSGSFDPKSVNNLDWAIMGIGLLVFIFSFISFYDGADVTLDGRSDTIDGTASAWHDIFGGGFFGWFAMLFAIVGAVALAISLFAPQVSLPVAARVGTVVLFAAALLFEIIAIFLTPGDSESAFGSSASVSLNHGFGFWASLILIAAGAVLALMRAQQTNTALPGPLSSIPRIGA